MRIKHICTTLLISLLLTSSVFGQQKVSEESKKIVVLGSSVASGWVTSYQDKYDMQNGYAYRLARLLEPRGWEVVNISIPGFDTKSTIERFENDVLPIEAGYVIIGLSMSNEGLETQNPDSVSLSYETGIKRLIGLCHENGINPVVGLCYSNDNYTEEQYAYLKKMNRKIASWDVPTINFLGALDDGHGHFPAGYTFDPNHPDDRGHEEMFYAFVPDMFEAMQNGKDIVSIAGKHDKMFNLDGRSLSYVPSEVMHSFTVSFNFSIKRASVLLGIKTPEGMRTISVSKDGLLSYGGQKTAGLISKSEQYKLTITHQFLEQKTVIYLDDKPVLETEEQMELLAFLIGNEKAEIKLNSLFIYRAALNPEEVELLFAGNNYNASLEVASLISAKDFTIDNNILSNHAISLGHARIDDSELEAKIEIMTNKVSLAEQARNNELVVEHRKAINIDPGQLDQYVGTYEIEPGDNMLIVKEGDVLYLDDHGRKASILPEGNDQFFIRYPGDILVIFQRDEDGKISGLIFSMNGREMPAKKIE